MIRMVNMGAVIHQMHFHGNHVWTVRRNGADFPRSGGRVNDEGPATGVVAGPSCRPAGTCYSCAGSGSIVRASTGGVR